MTSGIYSKVTANLYTGYYDAHIFRCYHSQKIGHDYHRLHGSSSLWVKGVQVITQGYSKGFWDIGKALVPDYNDGLKPVLFLIIYYTAY